MRLLPAPYESLRRDGNIGDARWLLLLCVTWAVPGMLGTTETVAFWRMSGQDWPMWRAFAFQMPQWFVYAALTGPILWAGERIRIVGPRWPRALAAHGGLALLCGLPYAVVAATGSTFFSPFPSDNGFGRLVLGWYLSGLPLMLMAYFGIQGAGRAVYWFFRNRASEISAARLEARLADARLSALRMQLHPHFLFNSLNAVTVLVRDRASAAAERAVHLLSELLRESLREDGPDRVPLRQEVDFALRYLELERLRFSDRLRIVSEVDDGVADSLVPVFVLQPLVENALRHGIAPKAEGGTIMIRATSREGRLIVTVEDDGRGLPSGAPGATQSLDRTGGGTRVGEGTGLGIKNVRERLAILYGADASLELLPAEGQGTIARLTFPLVATSADPVAPGAATPAAPVTALRPESGAESGTDTGADSGERS